MATPNPFPPLSDKVKQRVGAALKQMPSGLYVLTAHHEERRMGMLASWVQQACFEPPMLTVAIAKGRPIMPLISESRRFAVCQLGDKSRTMMRKFSKEIEPGDDPFLGYDLLPTELPGLPVFRDCIAYLECELAAHMDVEGDHDIFVGAIRGGGTPKAGEPAHVHWRESGFKY